jgi:polysaccharide biosynthesis/export protein
MDSRTFSRTATIRRRVTVVAAVWLGVVGLASAVKAQTADYVVGAQDVLTVNVWGHTDLSGQYSVETDGTFTFPLVGRIKAGGLTLRGLEEELKKQLADGYLKNPQVSVAVDQYRSQRIFVIGEVRQPGTYSLTGRMTLVEALARAGPTTADAAGEAIIVHPPAGEVVEGPLLPQQAKETDVTRVDLRQLQSGEFRDNVTVRDGDTIFVPRIESVYVFGQVKSPGAYPAQRGTTVMQTLSLAGGVTDRGSTGRITVIRVVGGKKEEIKVKLSDLVQPGDTITVRERFF